MRNKHKLITAVLALSLVANFAFAEDSATSGSSLSGKFTCTTNADGSQQCVRQDGGIKPSDDQNSEDSQKLEDRKNRGRAIEQVEKNQINRAQNAVDRLQNIVDRIEAYRAKMDPASPDLANIDTLIAKAKTQATDVKTAMDDVKAKAAALQDALTAATTDSVKTAPKQQVKDLQTSVKILKTKLNTLHSTLVSIVQLIKKDEAAIKSEDQNKSDNQNATEQESDTHNSTSGSTADEENK